MKNLVLLNTIVCLFTWSLWSCTDVSNPVQVKSIRVEPVSASILYRQAQHFTDSARYTHAFSRYQQAASLFARQKNWPLYLDCLNQTGWLYYIQSRPKLARIQLKKSIELGIAYMGAESEPVAQAYLYLGQVELLKDNPKEADSLFRLTYQIRRKLYGENNSRTLTSLLAIGYVHMARSNDNFTQALAFAQTLLKQRSKLLGEAHPDLAENYLLLGQLYNRRVEFGNARNVLKKSQAILIKHRSAYDFDLGRLYTELGNMYSLRGYPKKAKGYYQEALRIYKVSSGARSLFAASVYGSLADLNRQQGDNETAINYYRYELEAEKKFRGQKTQHLADIYTKIGNTYNQLGEPGMYLENCKIAFAISQEISDSTHTSMGNMYFMLGSSYYVNKLTDSALYYYKKAKMVFTKAQGPDYPNIAGCYQGMAKVFRRKKDYDKALQLYKKALPIYDHWYGKNYYGLALIHKCIGDVWLQDKSNPDSALVSYQQALTSLIPTYQASNLYQNPKLAEIDQYHILVFNILSAKSQCLRKLYFQAPSRHTSDLVFALQTLDLTIALIDKARIGFKGEETRLLLGESSYFVYAQALEIAYLLYKQSGDVAYQHKAFFYSEKGKVAVLMDVTKNVTAEQIAGIPKTLLAKNESLKTEISFYEKKIVDEQIKNTTANQAQINAWEIQVAKLKEALQQQIAELEQNYPEYYRLKYDTKVATVPQVQEQITQGQALISYALTDSLLHIFVITSDQLIFQTTPHAAVVREQIQVIRKALQDNHAALFQESAYALYSYLLTPVLPSLKRVKKLMIIPDGTIGNLPFEILLTKAVDSTLKYGALPYLLLKYPCTYNYSATLFVENTKTRPSQATYDLLAFAPRFQEVSTTPAEVTERKVLPNDTLRTQLLPLVGAQEEAKHISEITHGQYWSGDEATESYFKQMAGTYGVLHLATHALMDDKNPSYSKLVFAVESPDSPEDGYLHTYELYNLKLNAQLVTLSACNTGNGKIHKGEGIMSLARGFAYAGCSNIIMSLWPTPDRATSQIMKYFYESLAEGLPKDEALYQAKIKYVQYSDGLLANPRFWGSFVLIGDTDPIHFSDWVSKIFSMIVVLAFTCIGAFAWQYKKKRKLRSQLKKVV
jgi:CHAT domain-containing protein